MSVRVGAETETELSMAQPWGYCITLTDDYDLTVRMWQSAEHCVN